MIGLTLYILILLAISAVAMFFIFRVLLRQINLFKYPIADKNVKHFRYALFFISITIIVSGLIPIGINLLTLLVNTGRPDTVSAVSFVYSLSVHVQTLLLSYLLWRIYRLANSDSDKSDGTTNAESDVEKRK